MERPDSLQVNVPLAPYTSWLVGGPADFFALPQTLSELMELQRWARVNQFPMTVLGGGSNVLISDQGVSGLTICLKKLVQKSSLVEGDRFTIECEAGLSKSELLKIFLQRRLAPALFLAGLPGDVGGGVVMNAGVAEDFSPREFHEIVEWVDVLKPEGAIQRFHHDEIKWSYRHSHGWQPGIVIKTKLSWSNQEVDGILEKVKTANRTRLSKQPLDMPSCGSVFVNPEGGKAAQLIESCGLKGFRIGEAEVSMKHSNFIVNRGQAKASDIASVIGHVKKIVQEKTQVELKTEVIFLGKGWGMS